MTYIYALAAGLPDVADLKGIADEALVAVSFGQHVLLCGEMPVAPTLDAAVLKMQDALVRVLHARASALLPMRFGTTAGTTDEAQEKVRALEGLDERLDAVQGCEQMTVRVLGASLRLDGNEPPPHTGTEYLEARARRQQTSPVLRAIADAAGELARDVRIESGSQPGMIGSVYHLIVRGDAERYRATLDRAGDGLAGARLIVTGPSPAYAFA